MMNRSFKNILKYFVIDVLEVHFVLDHLNFHSQEHLFSFLGDARKCYSCDTVQDPNKDCNDAANYKEDECLSNDSSCSKVVQNGSKLDTIRSNKL